MKCFLGMGIQNFIKINSGIQKLLGGGYTRGHTGSKVIS
jgi:hypothetical protein